MMEATEFNKNLQQLQCQFLCGKPIKQIILQVNNCK